MHTLRIEIDRGSGWEPWTELETEHTIDDITMWLRVFAANSGHAYRAYLNGVLVAAIDPVTRRTVGQRKGAA